MFPLHRSPLLPAVRHLLLGLGFLAAADWSLRPAVAQFPDAALHSDLIQSLQARRLLLDDPELAPLNLGVKVTHRVAVLWGPVPSAGLAFRAEARLRTMIELIAVHNQLHLVPDNGPAAVPAIVPPAPQFLPDRLPPALPSERRPVGLPVSGNGVVLAGIVPN